MIVCVPNRPMIFLFQTVFSATEAEMVDVSDGSLNEPALAGGAGGAVGRLRLPQ
jgi:hypothetical protein